MQFTKAILAAALIGLMSACSGQAPLAELPTTAQTPAEQVAAALGAGSEASSDKARMVAARKLAALGARQAIPGEPDLAASWSATQHGGDAAPIFRGRMLGPAYRKGLVSAGAQIRIEQVFMAGQVAEVVVAPSTGAQLNLTVANPAGQEVCKRRVLGPPGKCSWRPPFAGRYWVEISNSGARDANFFLVVN